MPSVYAIDLLLEEWARELYPLKVDQSKSLYSWVKGELNSYITQHTNNRVGVLMGFESMLFTIQQIASLSRDLL